MHAPCGRANIQPCVHAIHAAGGHYTANVRQPDGRWLLYNDAHVSFVEERRVLQERPYLLFYERAHEHEAHPARRA